MELSEILNVVLGGSLVGALISIVTIRSALKKARAEAEKALAEADTVKITNTEQATRILVDNIVKPLTEELNETRKEISSIKREVARLRKAIDGANSCRYNADCPVLERMRITQKDNDGLKLGSVIGDYPDGQRGPTSKGRHKRVRGEKDQATGGTDVGGEPDDTNGQPHGSSKRCELQRA